MFGPAPGPLTVRTSLQYMTSLPAMIPNNRSLDPYPTPPFKSQAEAIRSLQLVSDYRGRILQKIAERLPGMLDVTI